MKCGSKCEIKPKKKSAAAEAYGKISVDAVEVLIRSKVPLVVLDARAGEWDDGKRIPGAKHLTSERAAKDAAKLIPSKKSLIIIYCTNLQCPAGGYLADRLLDLGYVNILKYPEGIQGWIASGRAVKKVALSKK